MNRLNTCFAGLPLNNPFIVSSSGLTSTPEKNKKWEDAGVGAIVLKSLFQEEIEQQSSSICQGLHSEEQDYLSFYQRGHCLDEYIQLVRESKQYCSIPIIANINCHNITDWTYFAKNISDAGADAIELNMMSICGKLDYKYGDFERMHIDVLRTVKSKVNIPIIMKLGNNFTNCIPLIHQLYANGASGVVLFNRMVSPDIDIESQMYVSGSAWRKLDFSETLRWTAMTSAYVPHINIAASGGVDDGRTLIKALLAGASAVEVCSSLYRNGVGVVSEMLFTLQAWMHKHGYRTIDEFKGIMNSNNDEANAFERTQFYRLFSQK